MNRICVDSCACGLRSLASRGVSLLWPCLICQSFVFGSGLLSPARSPNHELPALETPLPIFKYPHAASYGARSVTPRSADRLRTAPCSCSVNEKRREYRSERTHSISRRGSKLERLLTPIFHLWFIPAAFRYGFSIVVLSRKERTWGSVCSASYLKAR